MILGESDTPNADRAGKSWQLFDSEYYAKRFLHLFFNLYSLRHKHITQWRGPIIVTRTSDKMLVE